jgi:hypothetical protein
MLGLAPPQAREGSTEIYPKLVDTRRGLLQVGAAGYDRACRKFDVRPFRRVLYGTEEAGRVSAGKEMFGSKAGWLLIRQKCYGKASVGRFHFSIAATLGDHFCNVNRFHRAIVYVGEITDYRAKFQFARRGTA